MNLGETLKELRIKKSKTQMQVSNKLKISQAHLSQIEGNKKEPSPEMLRKICKLYNVPPVVVIWMSATENDVNKNKIEAWRVLKPSVDALIKEYISSP